MSAEKVIRYIEDKVKTKVKENCRSTLTRIVIATINCSLFFQENLIEKLHQKNAGLLAYKKKLQIQLKQQEEMGEGLTALDFEQLKFQNMKCRKRQDEQNLKHMELKLLAGKTLHVLNSEKVRCLINHKVVHKPDMC